MLLLYNFAGKTHTEIMRNILTTFGLVVLFLLTATQMVKAEETTTPVPPKQENEKQTSPLSIYVDLKSRHTWRGGLTVKGFNVQPNLVFKKKGFTIGAWGAYALDDSYAEVDLYASYQYKFIKFCVSDYFVSDEKKKFNNYFDWNNNTSRHTIDMELKFTGTKKLPVYLMVSTMVFGNKDAKGEEQYSTYLEAGYTLPLSKYAQKLDFFIGATPFEGSYSDKFNVVNIGMKATKNFVISEKFKLPVYSKFIVNPYRENIYLVFGVTI
jgi:hypothetical protein